MKTSLSDAIKLTYASKVNRKTALAYFQDNFICEQDKDGGKWWIHLDKPKADPIPQTVAGAIFARCQNGG